VLVLGAIGHEEQETGGGQPVDQAVEPRLGLGVDPVQILKGEQQGLDLALAQDHVREGFERVLPALARLELLPPRVLDGHTEERLEGGRGGPQALAERGEPRTDPRAHVLVGVALSELEVAPQQRAHGQVADRLAVG
jgi:hypothetical protein